jgi:hypothetical protein
MSYGGGHDFSFALDRETALGLESQQVPPVLFGLVPARGQYQFHGVGKTGFR